MVDNVYDIVLYNVCQTYKSVRTLQIVKYLLNIIPTIAYKIVEHLQCDISLEIL